MWLSDSGDGICLHSGESKVLIEKSIEPTSSKSVVFLCFLCYPISVAGNSAGGTDLPTGGHASSGLASGKAISF